MPILRIRRVLDDTLPSNRHAVQQSVRIMLRRFPGFSREDISLLPDRLKDPVRFGYRTLLYVADDGRGRVRGMAVVMMWPRLRGAYLDFIATLGPRTAQGGVGQALYQRARDEARELGMLGLFFDVDMDDARFRKDERDLAQARARLRFYERFGARPMSNELWPIVYDDLDLPRRPTVAQMRALARMFMRRHESLGYTPARIERAARSFTRASMRRRPFRYVQQPSDRPSRPAGDRIVLVVNDRHAIHHVRERGYVESPVRIASILSAIVPTGLFRRRSPRPAPDAAVTRVHDAGMVEYLRRASAAIKRGETTYATVFPLRSVARRPASNPNHAGYYCNDYFTPLHRNVYAAARRAVDCALTAAGAIESGDRFAYALVRPPGHHAESRIFGGFCYLNAAAIAADHLSRHGRVSCLDIDFHHGNGQQEIFWRRRDVLTVSIHGDPSREYPFFTGFPEEVGQGPGRGYNLNIVVPAGADGTRYRPALRRALARIARHKPDALVLSLGLDTAKGDPTGNFRLTPEDFYENARLVRALGVPTLVVQEGGYNVRTIGAHARAFFLGLAGCEWSASTSTGTRTRPARS